MRIVGIAVAGFVALTLLWLSNAAGDSRYAELEIRNGTQHPISVYQADDGESLLCRTSVGGGLCGYAPFSVTPGPHMYVAKKDTGTVVQTCSIDISGGKTRTWIVKPDECEITAER
jgi:hypothetical protein